MSKLLEYMDDLMHYKLIGDEEIIESLKEEVKGEYVTIEDAGNALLEITQDIANYVDTTQALLEVRLKAIVSNLPKEVKNNILEEFNQAQDDLFKEEEEGTEYDNE